MTIERLIRRANIIQEQEAFMSSIKRTTFLKFGFKPLTTFSKSDDFKLPLIIEGRLITSGTYPDENIGEFSLSESELKKSMSGWEGIKIFKDHSAYLNIKDGIPVPIDMVVGKIMSVSWNSKDKAIDFVAEIDDRNIAFKMLRGLIDSVSVGFLSDVVLLKGKQERVGIIPKELSLVHIPKDEKAIFKIRG